MDQRTIPFLDANGDNRTEISFHQDKRVSARDAYFKKDKEASRRAHISHLLTPGHHCHVERHVSASSEYLKCLVFGGLDGIVTIFAIVAGCVGAHLSPVQTLIVGIGNLLADAISMGFGEYVGASTESDFISSEKAREMWELENFPEGEKHEMMDIYESKYGFTHQDAQTMVDIAFKYKDFYISHMMAEELGLLVDDECPSPAKRGGVMFLTFCIFGLVPLAGFSLVTWMAQGDLTTKTDSAEKKMQAFGAASLMSCITLFVLGAVKATFINQSSIRSGVQMVANGAFAGIVAFGVGAFLQEFVAEPTLG